MNILIAGLAKTGTTILFSRIRKSLANEPLLFFEPKEKDEFLSIFEQGKTKDTLTKALVGHVTAKSHFLDRMDRIVLIVRDPRDQFISEMLYDFYKFKANVDKKGFEEGYQLLKRKTVDPDSISCNELFTTIRELATGSKMKYSPIKLLRSQYSNLNDFQLAFNPFVLHYEKIIDDDLSGLSTYLELPTIVPAEVDRQYSRVVRSKGYGEWKQWLTDSDIEAIQKELGEIMVDFGYQITPSNEVKRISIETSLKYVEQFRP